MSVPSQEKLAASVGEIWHIGDSNKQTLACQLVKVETGVAMSPQYTCYSALLRLPPGARIDQGIYNLIAADGACWPLLMTPMAPDANGDFHLEICIHCLKPEAAATA